MHSFYLPSPNLDLVLVEGPDAVKLLQGQLTCDVAALADPGFCRGALCNNKGRVLATFILVRQGAAYYLAMHKGLGDVCASVLKKFLPFYHCTLRQIPAGENVGFGMCGQAAARILAALAITLPGHNQCIRLADGWMCNLDQAQQQFLVYSKALQTAVQHSQGDLTTGTLGDWLLSGIESGQFPFQPDDVEKYTPQELHLDRHGYVSFSKGCYTGQEIVARMHYRGKHKKILFLLSTPDVGDLEHSQSMAILDTNGELLGTTLKTLQHRTGTLVALAALPAEMEQTLPALVKNAAGANFTLRPF